MAQVGFSTGCLYGTALDLFKRAEIYKGLGADAIELSFAEPKQVTGFELTPKLIAKIDEFDFVTIHAPWINTTYNSRSKDLFEKLGELTESLQANGVVFHPDIVEPDLSVLAKSGLPVLIENMDKRKEVGISPVYFQAQRDDYGFGFVLDLQHVYEHDMTMRYAEKLIDAMGDNLSHMHVSGQKNKKRHYPTFFSGNVRAIAKILERGIEVPKILEGIITGQDMDTVRQELAFVRSYEK